MSINVFVIGSLPLAFPFSGDSLCLYLHSLSVYFFYIYYLFFVFFCVFFCFWKNSIFA